jgi:hypothetical protein
MKITDVIWFIRYSTDQYLSVYRCRGIGPTYDKFYRNLPKSYRCLFDDFPWDHFVFDDGDEEAKFCEEYAQFISDDMDAPA